METQADSWRQSFVFWKNLVLVTIFFTITPIALAISLFSLISLGRIQTSEIKDANKQEPASLPNFIVSPKSGVSVYASLPSSYPSVSGIIESSDARPEIIRQYLGKYKSPLEPLSDLIVESADKYQLDFRLTTAIAQKESNLCKLIPGSSFNCWGWGIHSKGTLGFSSFGEGIEAVSRGIREEYLNKGYQTIEEIMGKYTPLSSGSWADGVNKFMNEMQ